MFMQKQIAKINNYLSLVKFAHSIFALPFALTGFFMGSVKNASGVSWLLLLLVILCMVFARNAAMSFNRWADRDIDSKNPRTAQRDIPAKRISAHNALAFCIANCIAFIVTTYFINDICFYLSPVALIVILGYSYTKRFTALAHFILGVGLALAPTGAYLAVTGAFGLEPLLLSFAVLCWVTGFDIIYALQDDNFDKENSLHSIPARLGRSNALMLSNILHVLSTVFLVILGYGANYNWIYWTGVAIFAGLLLYQHSVVKINDLSRVNFAFFTLNGIASLIFATFAILGLYF